LDLAAGGTGDISSWSKFMMGWVNRSQILTVDVPGSRIFTLAPLENPGTNPMALQLNLGRAAGEYWVEVREDIGYDRSSLPDYGAFVYYISPTNSSIQYKKTLQPEIISEAVFIDPSFDLAIIALNVTQGGMYQLFVGDEQDGRNAQITIYAIDRAQAAITEAETENRFEGLDLAQSLLSKAQGLLALGSFTDANALAVSAETTANDATVPPDYSQAAQLLLTAESLRNDTANQNSANGGLLQQADMQLDSAMNAFQARDFAAAAEDAQSAISLYNQVKQMQLLDTVFSLLGNLALLVPVLVLAFALRYQLKRS